MANYNSLKATINANIKTNGNQEITGSVLNSVLNAMVNTLGAGYQYAGVATPSSNPGTPDTNVFYIAATAGTYTNIGGLVVSDGEVAILKYNGTWTKDVTGAATAKQVSQLYQEENEKIQLLQLEELPMAVLTQTWVNPTTMTHYVIPVNGGDSVLFDNTIGVMYCVFLKSYTTPVMGAAPDFCTGYEGRQTKYETSGAFSLPADCRYLIINNPNGQYTMSSLKINGVEMMSGVRTNLAELSKVVNDISQLVQSLSEHALLDSDLTIERISDNLADPNGIVTGKLLAAGGIIADNASWDMYKLPVTPGQVITFGGFFLGRSGYYGFFNGTTNLSTVAMVDPNGTERPMTVTVPENATHLYFDIKSANSPSDPYSELQINIGNTLLDYDEYKVGLVSIAGYEIEGAGGGGQDLSTLIQDLPVSVDGSDISIGYAYINAGTGAVIVKQ